MRRRSTTGLKSMPYSAPAQRRIRIRRVGGIRGQRGLQSRRAARWIDRVEPTRAAQCVELTGRYATRTNVHAHQRFAGLQTGDDHGVRQRRRRPIETDESAGCRQPERVARCPGHGARRTVAAERIEVVVAAGDQRRQRKTQQPTYLETQRAHVNPLYESWNKANHSLPAFITAGGCARMSRFVSPDGENDARSTDAYGRP